jgi:predicted RNA binding protein YcfA (HicA-like mRNA interferase family)
MGLWYAQFVAAGKGGLQLPRKVRDLIRDLKRAGFADRGGEGSHRNFVHPSVRKSITLSGNEGDDALPYQEKAVRMAIEESKR